MSCKVMIGTLVSLAGLAFGQSLNLDINVTSSPGNGKPGNSFAGAAGQPGHWDWIAPSTSGNISLRGLDGNYAGVTVTRTGSWGNGSDSISGASAEFSSLMFDYGRVVGQNGFLGLQFNGLDAGMYRVVVYACMPGNSGRYTNDWGTQYHMSQVSVSAGNVVQGFGAVGGQMQANTFTPGVTHYSGVARIPNDSTSLTVLSYTDFDVNVPIAAINGVQLVKYDNRIYVRASATGAKTGHNWDNAFTDLQEALALAQQSQGMINEIWVAAGSYMPTTGTDRTKTFTIPSGVKLYGGFSGNESALEQRPMAFTVLSGGIGAPFSYADDSYHVITIPAGSSNTVVDGFVITQGNANGSGMHSRGGGAFIGQASFVFFRNCDFRQNRATQGGAIFAELAYPRLANSIFRWNHATSGGAIYHLGSTTGFLPPYMVVSNCRVFGNEATTTGGGIVVANGDSMISGSLIYGNQSAGHGGGVYVTGGGVNGTDLLVANCTIVNNHAGGRAGGLYAAADGEIAVRNSIIWSNTAADAQCAIACSQATWSDPGTYIAFDRCILMSAGSFFSTQNTIDADPRFVDPANNNYRLRPNSPAIDRGSNLLIPTDLADVNVNGDYGEALPLDLDRNPRRIDTPHVADTGVGTAPIVDIGAYEFVPTTCAADLSGSSDPSDPMYGIPDGVVDAGDFFFFLDAFASGNVAIADLSSSSDPNNPGYGVPDGVIDASDFFYYLDLFVAGCP
ncbi:MAG: hypothetical protein KF866_02660 [Phycisphaeraceae bacterium]|nr:hypothetical protein [Phycisphaeraceae bacterium]MCW5753402.1 hypothetical protein [Phycisphaeraceae bacterium]